MADNLAIGTMGARHLIGQGYRHLVFFSISAKASVVCERLSGFRKTAAEAGCPVSSLHFDSAEAKDVVEWLAQQLASLPKPLGVMAHYDVEADFVVNACIKAGLRIPEDVAILGVDNDYVHCELGRIPLSSIDCNFTMLGYRAAEVLHAAMANPGRQSKKPVLIAPKEVVVRRSTDMLMHEGEYIRKALAFIHANFNRSVGVDEVAKASGVSRRQLYRLFEEKVGRTVHRLVLEHRIAYAKRLLAESEFKIDMVAQYAGFGSAEHFSKTFSHHVGLTPSAFRNSSSVERAK